jgi:acyl dehydratase
MSVDSSHPNGDLPAIEKTISRDQILRYSQASGDFNPVHLDEDFAAKSSFGRIVAHGMMTLAFLSEMLTVHFGVNWLSTGSLKVRFKRPAYPDDTLRTWGKVTRREEASDHTLVKCDVALRNASNNEELITGTATVRLPKGQDTP